MSPTDRKKSLSRRDFLRIAGLTGIGTGLVACSPQPTAAPAQQVITKEVPVERTVEVQVTSVVEKLVTPTPVAYKKGGRMVIALNGDIKTLDPHISNLAVWQNIRRQIFDQLLRIDENGTVLPHLAKEFVWVDNKTLELTLEEGVVFHNGEPFTAEDVKYTFDRLLKSELPSEYPPRLAGVESYEVVSPYTFRFKLSGPDSTFPGLLTLIDILCKSVSEEEIPTTPVGTGAFKFVEWLPNEQITLQRNENYWKPDEPYLDEIVYRPIPDPESRIASLIAGDVDVDFAVSLKDIPRLATTPGIRVERIPGGGISMVYLNLRKKPFDDVRVRQALLYGINREQYNRDFLMGLSRVTNTEIEITNWGYNPAVDEMYKYDPEKAIALLNEAGYNETNPLAIEVIYPVGLEDYKSFSEFFQSQMKDIGVEVKVTGMELAKWSNKIIKEKDYDLAFDGRGLVTNDPADMFNDTTFTKPHAENFDGFTEDMIPGYLDLINQGIAETDQEKRKEIYFELQKLWAENLPGWILTANPSNLVCRDWVRGYTAYGSGPFRLNKAWLDK